MLIQQAADPNQRLYVGQLVDTKAWYNSSEQSDDFRFAQQKARADESADESENAL